ncbi:MAG TPA: 2OG-Fe(II) oxygenase [Pyrinomonadaceae bacterium]|nr:2OG-Fe(II) oxygenase [Pyrinomonadaceae bacterium]
MIQVTRRGTELSSSTEALAALRDQFEQRHYFLLPGLLEPELVDLIQQQIDRGEFRERVHEDIDLNKELCLTKSAAFGALLFLMNDEKLFQLIEDITRCDRINCFEGRVYRVNPGEGHHDSWHNDIGEGRLVGLSLNLSRKVYAGGVLQIRNRESGALVSEAANIGSGDAVIFRLSRDLQHRITDVEGSASKTAFAGWFRSQPNVSSSLTDGRPGEAPFSFRIRSRGPITAEHLY